MTDTAQAIVDELARSPHLNSAVGTVMRDRILAAASKPKHPTPDQFIELGLDWQGSPDTARRYIAGLLLDSKKSMEPLLNRQLDAANHAIATAKYCQHLLANGDSPTALRQLGTFLGELQRGDDFTDVPESWGK